MPRTQLPALLLGLAAVVPLLAGCAGDPAADWPDRPGPKVVVTFAPLYCFVANVAGDDAAVKNMMTTTGPHNFNPTAAEARLVRRADLLFVNGLGLDEKAADTLKQGSGNARLKVVELGERLAPLPLLQGVCYHVVKHDHEHGTDPHVWLGIDYAAKMVEAVRDELKAADPAHAADYDRRAAEYVKKLEALKAEGVALLKDKTDRQIVSFHESLNYFATTFNLKVSGVVQKQPGVEPGAAQISELAQACAKDKVRVIAVEPQFSTIGSAQTVLTELKAKGVPDPVLVEIDPLETVKPSDLTADWYERKTRENLKALAAALR